MVLARWGAELLVTFLASGRESVVLNLQLDLRILGFTAAVSILTGIVFGFIPGIRATHIDLAPVLKVQRGGSRIGGFGWRSGKVLVVSQVALCLLLLIGAGLFTRSLQKLNSQDTGVDRDSVLVVRVEPKGSDQRGVTGTSQRLHRTYRDLIAGVESIPGVRSASMARFTPTSPISFSAQLKSTAGDNISIPSVMAYPNYFATMGMPIVAGRDFSPGDLEESGPFVMVVNQTFARQVFKGEDPVGKRISTRLTGRSLEIIGVVKDSRYANLRGETPPVMYQPFLQTQTGRGQMVLYVRAAGNSGLILPRVREEVQKIDGSLPLFEIRTLAEEMNAALIRERLIASLSGFFGILAMLLASIGLYGLLAFSVVQRTGEIGIRMALGARPGAVMWMVTREALLLVLIGVLVGIPAALAMAHLASNQISGLLFGLSPTDPLTIAAATALLVWVAIVAGYLPARRASRVDPIMALRNE